MRVNNVIAIAAYCDRENIGEHMTISIGEWSAELNIFFGSLKCHATRAKREIEKGCCYNPTIETYYLEESDCWVLQIEWSLPEKQ